MKRQKISNEKLDSIGAMLLEAGKLTQDDIDQIAAQPDIFSGVRRGIEVERTRLAFAQERTSRWRRTFVLIPAMASFVVVAMVYVSLVSNRTAINAPLDVASPPETALVQTIDGQVTGEINVRQHTVARPPVQQVKRPAVRQHADREEMSDFYALTYDDSDDIDLRMIRTELPRASLIAMGLNLHLESESDKVKTDLLVGTDGVPRAIRIVK